MLQSQSGSLSQNLLSGRRGDKNLHSNEVCCTSFVSILFDALTGGLHGALLSEQLYGICIPVTQYHIQVTGNILILYSYFQENAPSPEGVRSLIVTLKAYEGLWNG